MRFAITCVIAAYMRGEDVHELEQAQLTYDAVAIAARDYSELMARAEMLEDTAGSRHKLRTMRGVLLAPGAVGVVPTSTREFRGAIDAIPVRRVMTGEVVERPTDAHFAEH